jgi:hypothetical protein
MHKETDQRDFNAYLSRRIAYHCYHNRPGNALAPVIPRKLSNLLDVIAANIVGQANEPCAPVPPGREN